MCFISSKNLWGWSFPENAIDFVVMVRMIEWKNHIVLVLATVLFLYFYMNVSIQHSLRRGWEKQRILGV